MATFNVGIIGAVGRPARARARCLAENPGTKVVVCSAPDGNSAAILAARHKCRAAKKWQDVITDPDVNALCISSPGALHFEQAKAGIQHGKHVLVEYPITHSLEEAGLLKGLAAKKSVVLHHGLFVRGEPTYLSALDAIRRLGDISMARIAFFGGARMHVPKSVANDVFYTMYVRLIDHLRGWFGEVKAVTAKRKDAGAESSYMHNATAWFRLERCPMAMIELGVGYYHYPRYVVEIFGSEGIFEKSRGITLARDGRTTPISKRPNVAVKVDTQDFVAQMRDNAAPLRSWEDTLRTVATALRCVRPHPKSPGIDYDVEESESQIIALPALSGAGALS